MREGATSKEGRTEALKSAQGSNGLVGLTSKHTFQANPVKQTLKQQVLQPLLTCPPAFGTSAVNAWPSARLTASRRGFCLGRSWQVSARASAVRLSWLASRCFRLLESRQP